MQTPTPVCFAGSSWFGQHCWNDERPPAAGAPLCAGGFPPAAPPPAAGGAVLVGTLLAGGLGAGPRAGAPLGGVAERPPPPFISTVLTRYSTVSQVGSEFNPLAQNSTP